MRFHEDLLMSGTIYSPQIRPPVAEMKDPSDDQESLLLIDIPMLYLKYEVICVS